MYPTKIPIEARKPRTSKLAKNLFCARLKIRERNKLKYEFKEIEKKWQDIWEETKPFRAVTGGDKPKFYPLVEFPYPSGDGLHVGHTRPYTAMDIVARKKRKQGYNVLFPIGFDAFGLPTENYAIKNHMHPREVTKRNIKLFTEQLKMLGFSFDWDRVVDTTDPDYYKWTQWIFLQFYKQGLAYKHSMPVNWCTSCKIVLANEEVVNGVCERCSSDVVKKEKSQWMLAITKYAQRLIDDLDDLDFIERVTVQQKNWIGRSTGADVDFSTTTGDVLRVFTTRPDTLFGATYMVVSPEHMYMDKWMDTIENKEAVRAYIVEAGRKSDFERTELMKDKTGVRIEGVSAINPVTGDEIPIFISDYVLASYGTGAIMGVPGHDQRDWEFAKAFGLPIIEVVSGGDIEKEAFISKDDSAILVNSGFLNGLSVKDGIVKISEWLADKGLGENRVNYKLRDWVFSRQRYWGEPIPLINCPTCGWVPMDESELPLLLPDVESYEPTDTGESPLAKIREWVECECPKCGAAAERETDTMPNWAGSCWYFLRYMSPDCDTAAVSQEALDYWDCVDWYNGGMEHTTLHLLYSRFWHKFLFDIDVLPTKEPYKKRTSHGMILGETGDKMSKSRGNVVNPNDIVRVYGADTLRLYIMFIGDFEKTAPWSDNAVKGCKRFLDRVWSICEARKDGKDESYSQRHEKMIHKAIKKIGDDIEQMKFNTAIATMMAMINEFSDTAPSRGDVKALLTMLSPFAPHIAEELWERQGFSGKASEATWPEYDEAKTVDAQTEIAVQVNGKLRSAVVVPTDCAEDVAIQAALSDAKIQKQTEGKQVVKTIVIKNKLVNIIIK